MDGNKLSEIQTSIERAQMRVLDVILDITDSKGDDENTAKLRVAKNLLDHGLDLLENDSWICDGGP